MRLPGRDPRSDPSAPGVQGDPEGPSAPRRFFTWFHRGFVWSTSVLLSMIAVVALVLSHAVTSSSTSRPTPPPIIAPLAPPNAASSPPTDWPGYAPDAPVTGGAPSRGTLEVYRAVALARLGAPPAAPLGYVVWAALDLDGVIDFDADPRAIVAFDYQLADGDCARSSIARGYDAPPSPTPCVGEPLPFEAPDLSRVAASVLAACGARGARVEVRVSHAYRWMELDVLGLDAPSPVFHALATRDGRLLGADCHTR